jgi:sugar lactone lactonase YvrE
LKKKWEGKMRYFNRFYSTRDRDRTSLGIAVCCFAVVVFSLVSDGVIPAFAQDSEDFRKPLFLYSCPGCSQDDRFKLPRGIFFDTHRKEIYVADSGNQRIVVLDSVGMPLWHFPYYVEDASGCLSIPGEPNSVAADSQGRIFVPDAVGRKLRIFDFRGTFLEAVDISEKLDTPDVRPNVVTVDGEDNVYVGTSGAVVGVAKFNTMFELQKLFLPADGESLLAITCVWVDESGKVYVTDGRATPCVRVFSPTGETLLGFGAHDAGWANFSFPGGVTTTSDGRIWVVDGIRQIVTCFGPDGTYLGKFGGLGAGAGDMYFPSAVTGNGKEKLLVLESNGARFQAFVVPPNVAEDSNTRLPDGT